MTKEEKIQLVNELADTFRAYPNFYIVDAGGMTVEQVNALRRKCFETNIKMQTVKNTLIRKALEQVGGDYSELYDALKEPSSVFFTTAETPNLPAKMLKEFRRTSERPKLKAACIDFAVFKGDDQIDGLINLKTKADLVGEVIGLLQSPAQQVISALQSGGATIAGLVKTLSEREE
jgi:large subunit ribosomal protein L10